MSDVKIISHVARFKNASDAAWDMALGHMAIDIVRLSALQVPHDTGRLQSSKQQGRERQGRQVIRYRTEYAHATHENVRGVKFKKGRKDHYLSDPGDQISKNFTSYMNEAMNMIRSNM